MTDFQYVVLSNRLTVFNDNYNNNNFTDPDAIQDVKDPSKLFTVNLSKPLILKPFSEVKVCFFHFGFSANSARIVSTAIECPNLPLHSTPIGNPEKNGRLAKLVGFVGSNSERSSMDDGLFFPFTNTTTEVINSIDCRIIRLGDGREPKQKSDADQIIGSNITIGLQIRVNPYKLQESLKNERDEIIMGHIKALQNEILNKKTPDMIKANEITNK